MFLSKERGLIFFLRSAMGLACVPWTKSVPPVDGQPCGLVCRMAAHLKREGNAFSKYSAFAFFFLNENLGSQSTFKNRVNSSSIAYARLEPTALQSLNKSQR